MNRAAAKAQAAEAGFPAAPVETLNLVVQATAGSGKTTTALAAINNLFTADKVTRNTPQQEAVCRWVQAAWNVLPPSERQPDMVRFLAFNKAIAEELKSRMVNGNASTIHSLGAGLVYRKLSGLTNKRQSLIKLDTWKTANLFCEYNGLPDLGKATKETRELFDTIKELVSACKDFVITESHLEGTPHPLFSDTYDAAELLQAVADEREIEIDPDYEILDIVENVHHILSCSETCPKYDYDDMIYLPNRFGWKIDQPISLIVVDEAQDLSYGKQQLILSQPARIRVFIGDRNQAIYGFAGADCQSMSNIVRMTKAAELPLTKTFRCAKNIVNLAQAFVPVDSIEALVDAPVGTVTACREDSPKFLTKPQDLIVCRKNAPLLSMAWKLLKQRKPVYIVGGTLGRSLNTLIKKSLPASGLFELIESLNAFVDKRIAQMQKWQRNTDQQQEQLCDQRDCLVTLAGECKTDNITELTKMIDELFSAPARKEAVRLSSIHRAKGLESDRVWWLYPELCPSKMAKTPKALAQEANLQFVAVTRAKTFLGLISAPPKEDQSVTDEETNG
jgi:DNA helicase-2/ATP-dependent DNA helicase PcrA